MFYDELTKDYEAVEIPVHSVAYPLLKIEGAFRRALEHDYGVSIFVVSERFGIRYRSRFDDK